MESTRRHEIRRPRLAMLALLALTVVAFLGVVAQPAAAIEEWDGHGDASCSKCHGAGFNDNACTQSGCHTGGFTSRQTAGTATRNCWTCHAPGQSMTSVQTDPGCGTGAAGAACHNTATGHLGSNLRGCTTCHGTATAINAPDGSAHHNTTAFSAPTCTDCHKTGGPAVAPHPAYTAESCETCHAGVTPTHPAAMSTPTLAVTADPLAVTTAGGTTVVSGSLMNGASAIAGATVVLQKAATGTTTFTLVGTPVTTGADGSYAFPGAAPNGNTTFRVIARGLTAGQTVVRPVKGTVDVTAPAASVKPAVTIALSKTSILVNKRITIKGKVTPVKSGTVKIAIQRKTASGSYKTLTTKTVTLTAGATASTYTLSYKATKRGAYRVRTTSPASTGYLKATSVYKTFKVK